MNQENQLTEQNSEETEIDLLEIFYLLRAKLVWLILAFVIGGVIAGSITHFLITPKYTATAKMYMISASSGSVLDLSDFNIGTSLSQDYTELIKIRPVFNEVIDNLNLDMEYEDLLKKVSISVVGDSRLLAVSVEDNDPKLAQSMVNELVDTAVTYIPKVMNASENAQPTIAEYAVVPDEPSSRSGCCNASCSRDLRGTYAYGRQLKYGRGCRKRIWYHAVYRYSGGGYRRNF